MQSMWLLGVVSAIITTHDDKDDCSRTRETLRSRPVASDAHRIENCWPANMGSSSTDLDRALCFDLLRTNVSDQSAKRLEGAEWTRNVLSGQIVRGFGARDDAKRTGRIATRKKSPRTNERREETSDWLARNKASS